MTVSSPWLKSTKRSRGIDRIDPTSYTVAHGNGHSTQATASAWPLDRRRRSADDGRASILPTRERDARGAGVRRVRRADVPVVLRRDDGPSPSDARHVLPAVVGRLLRGHRLGAWHRLAGGGLARDSP